MKESVCIDCVGKKILFAAFRKHICSRYVTEFLMENVLLEITVNVFKFKFGLKKKKSKGFDIQIAGMKCASILRLNGWECFFSFSRAMSIGYTFWLHLINSRFIYSGIFLASQYGEIVCVRATGRCERYRWQINCKRKTMECHCVV